MRSVLVIIKQLIRQQGWHIGLMGIAYACVAGLIFMPLMQVYPQSLQPLWPYLLMGLVIICLMVGQSSLFDQDYQEGFLTWYYVHRPTLTGYILAKYGINSFLITIVILSVTALFGWSLMAQDVLITLMVTQGLSIVCLSALHMVISSLLLKLQNYRLVQMVILVPLAVPVVLLSYGLMEAGHFALHFNSLFVLFLSLSMAIIVVALAITPLALKEALRD
jgi:ABC-type transport system involved in cytochrome c biogenesis permease component